MNKYERLAQRLFDERRFPRVQEDVSLRHFEKQDVLVLRDRRKCERRDREWQGFRNYLYGYNCKILSERAAPDFAVMLIDASWDMRDRLARHFYFLTIVPQSIDEFSNVEEIRNDPQLLAVAERRCRPELYHSVWGRVAVENGTPIGLYVNGEIVRQPVNQHWTELSRSA